MAARLDLDQVLGQAAPDRLFLAAVAYLLLPGLLFLPGWALPIVGVPAALAGLGALLLTPGWHARWPLSATDTGWCLLGALAWAVLASGTHHLLYAAVDWQIRDAVLHDLSRGGWPVAYGLGDLTWLLRAPLGYYLPAALAGHALGAALALPALFLWTALGLALTLMLLLRMARDAAPGRRGAVAVMVGVFALFGGMDLLPNLWLDGMEGPGIHAYWGRGGEWWARLFQYSGHVTLLLWAPNHAMPAWIAALLLLRHGWHPGFAQGAALPLAAGCFWGPISAFGAAILVGWVLVAEGRVAAALRAPGNWLAALFALPIVLYLTAGSGVIEHHPLPATAKAAGAYARFLAVEVLAIGVPVLLLVGGRLLPVALGLLLVLPLYIFGPGNEMTMRGGIAPFAVLAVAAAVALLRATRPVWRAVLAGALMIGALGQAMEASILVNPSWEASRGCSVPEAARQSVFTETDWSHYVIIWPERVLLRLLRWPEERVVEAERVARCWPEGGGGLVAPDPPDPEE